MCSTCIGIPKHVAAANRICDQAKNNAETDLLARIQAPRITLGFDLRRAKLDRRFAGQEADQCCFHAQWSRSADAIREPNLRSTKYNYGGSKVISSAIAQADVLGLFGRYGVFVACNWGLGPS